MIQMRIAHLAIFAINMALSCILAANRDALPNEDPKVEVPTIEFKDLPKNCEKYYYNVTIEIEDSDKKYSFKYNTSPGLTGANLAFAMEGSLEANGAGECKYTRTEGRIELKGWTDPKTQKFHPIKSIKYESKNVPKECWPTIKMPPKL